MLIILPIGSLLHCYLYLFLNSDENVATVSTLSECSQKVVEAVEFLQSENKELTSKVKQLETDVAENTMLKSKVEKLETDAMENTYLKTKLQELEEAVNQLLNNRTAAEGVIMEEDLSNMVLHQLELFKGYLMDEND